MPKITEMSDNKRVVTLSRSIGALEELHGSVVADPSFPHVADPRKCACDFGDTIRSLIFIRREILKHKAKKTARLVKS